MSVEIRTHCIQPIEINIDILSKLFDLKINVESLAKFKTIDNESTPIWKKTMDELYNLYSSFIVLNFKYDLDYATFLKEITSTRRINAKFNLSRYISNRNFKLFLLFDYRLFQFCLIYELELKIPDSDIFELIKFSEKNLNLYNGIRNIFVKESDDAPQIKSITDIKFKVISFIENFMNEAFELKLPKNTFKILNNSGNLTNIIKLYKFGGNITRCQEMFITLNRKADRNYSDALPLNINQDLYYFSSRFHTIIIKNLSDEYRYIPIQFQMQYLWFYLSKQINLILERKNDGILGDRSLSKITKYNDEIDTIINKIENLNIFNQKFKLSIETDSNIYSIIESRWNIESMIKSSNNYVVFFKDYLSRLYIKKNSKTGQRQNRILLFISIFQFIALISVWNDYLQLLNDDLAKKAKGVLPLFGSAEFLTNFNLFLPFGLLVFIMFMFIYIYRRKD